MKIVTSRQMSEIESLAYSEGASTTEFMEEAGSGVALIVQDYVEKHGIGRTVILLCGKGNNGGDAYVAGTYLLNLDYDVTAIQIIPIEECSNLCKQSYERFVSSGGLVFNSVDKFPDAGIIIDGLFGTGFKGVPSSEFASLITQANESKLPIIAVDIPSGLNGETGEAPGEVIVATETAFLGLPKIGFFLHGAMDYVGKLRYVDFGLPKQYIEECASDQIMLTLDMVKDEMPLIKRTQHKYEAGYVVGLAGSPSMPGAAILASSSALRGGAGIVRLLYPEGMETEITTSPYELIRKPYRYQDTAMVIDEMNRATATFIGPGLGVTNETRALLRQVLPALTKPCVIDADALTILSEEKIPLPQGTIFTPHLGEMMRLLGLKDTPIIDAAFLKTCQDYANRMKITLILKGAPTFIFHHNSPLLINSTGDPGMATAGSGDVLTGLVAAFLAKKKPPEIAACLAVFLHGLAGEHAAEEMTSHGMIASDIIYHFPEAFKLIML